MKFTGRLTSDRNVTGVSHNPTYPQFDADTYRELGFYVYALSDPRNGDIFYVGKGKDSRWYSHIMSSRQEVNAEVSEKLDKIREIEVAGLPVQVHFLRSGLPTNRQGNDLAFLLEAVVIDALSLLSTLKPDSLKKLTNLVSGHETVGRSCLSLNQVAQLFNATPIGQIEEPVILLNLARTWTPDLSKEELWEFTRSAWGCASPRRDSATFVLAISHGIVRAGYAVAYWRPWGPGDRNYNDREKIRYVVECEHAPESHPSMSRYVQRHVKDLITNPQWNFRYINC